MASGAAALLSQINKFNLAASNPFPTYVPPVQDMHVAPSGWGDPGYAESDQSGIPHPDFWNKFAGSNPYAVKIEPQSPLVTDPDLRILRSRLRRLREDAPNNNAASFVNRFRRLRLPTVDSPISRRVAARRAALGSIV